MQTSSHESATDLPLFSIVIPCYNASATLARAVQSCFAQHERSLEILLVDDASTDDTRAIMHQLQASAPADLPVHCFHQMSNGGPSRARNRGWDEAKGRYIAFLDADDCWDADRLQRIRDVLAEADADVVLIGHPHRESDTVRPVTQPDVRVVRWHEILLRNLAQTSCIVVARRIGLRFDEGMRFTEDHDLWLRVARLGKVLRLQGMTMTRLGRPQMTAGGLSGQRWAMRKGEWQMYLKAAASDRRLTLALPFLFAFSLLKHVVSALRLAVRQRRPA